MWFEQLNSPRTYFYKKETRVLENFHLLAIVNGNSQPKLLRIPLRQELQNNLAESWEIQHQDFVDGVDEVNFNAGYKPEKHERFGIPEYKLPPWFSGINGQTILDLDRLKAKEELFECIQGIAGYGCNSRMDDLMLFQNFTRSQVIKAGRHLLFDSNTFRGIDQPGLTLDRSLSAVYLPLERKLLFKSFRTVNTFLPLSDFYREASGKEIREVLEHEMLEAEDPDALINNANQWFCKRISMLKDSGVLDEYSADEIKERSKGHNISIKVSNGKLAFPAGKGDAKKLLQFLNEELYRGPITETIFETNSKKQADT